MKNRALTLPRSAASGQYANLSTQCQSTCDHHPNVSLDAKQMHNARSSRGNDSANDRALPCGSALEMKLALQRYCSAGKIRDNM